MTKIKDAIEIHEKVEAMRNMLAELDLASVENKIEFRKVYPIITLKPDIFKEYTK